MCDLKNEKEGVSPRRSTFQIRRPSRLIEHLRIDRDTLPSNRVKRKAPVSPSDTKTKFAFLKSVMSELDLGKKVRVKSTGAVKPIHLNRKRDILAAYSVRSRGWNSWQKHSWKLKDIARHCLDKTTLYFTGSHERWKTHSLIMIDIDCHNGGSLAGATAFAEMLRANLFPNLYFERSTNGVGMHGYVLVNKQGRSTWQIREVLKRLEQHLRTLANGYDITDVEIKGAPPQIEWGANRFEISSLKMGTLAKLPREMFERWAEFTGTTEVTMNQLLRLQPLERWNTKEKAVSGTTTRAGSTSSKLFNKEQLSGLEQGGRHFKLASKLMVGKSFAIGHRKNVTVYDLAVTLMLGEFFTNNMNAEGTLPHARWEKLWTSLFETRDVKRAFNNSRFTACRNLLSDLGLISWLDNKYVVGTKKVDGKSEGRAMKWRFSNELMAALSPEESLQFTVAKVVVTEKGEKETSSSVTHFTSMDKSLSNRDRSEPIRPLKTFIQRAYLTIPDYSPPEIAKFVTHFGQLAA